MIDKSRFYQPTDVIIAYLRTPLKAAERENSEERKVHYLKLLHNFTKLTTIPDGKFDISMYWRCSDGVDIPVKFG